MNEAERHAIAQRIAADIPEGAYVNLGIGIPTLVAGYVADREIVFHSENGVLGVGRSSAGAPIDIDLIDASKAPIGVVPGASFFSHAESFAMIRGGHIDIAVMGAFQVSTHGDLANWSTGESEVPAVGGAMDLAAGARQVWVAMWHSGRGGEAKLVDALTYPVTALGVVKRIYTELAVLEPRDGVFVVRETLGLTLDKLQAATPGVRLVRPEASHGATHG